MATVCPPAKSNAIVCVIPPSLELPPPPQPLISAAQPSAIAENWNFIACLLMVVFLSALCCVDSLLMGPACAVPERSRASARHAGTRAVADVRWDVFDW
jgi:hypothetical protein